MIQIQRRQQFEKAAERLHREPQSIRRHEPGLYEVTNKTKGHTYHVRVERRDGHTFGTCTCEAGTPHKGRRVPMVCKHLAAVVLFLRAVREARRYADALALGETCDGDD
jgi:hypothetical protein